MPDLTVRSGSVVTTQGVFQADIAIEAGKIVAIAPELPGSATEIDARGLTIFPGLIDVHLHFNEPGRTDWEGASTGSRALAAAGGTLFFDMPLNSSPCTIGPAEFHQKRAALEQSSITDFALWGGIIPGNKEALAPLAACGVIGFKAFLSDSGLAEFPRADDGTLLEGMQEAARFNLPVAVHAENEEITRTLAARSVAAGRTGIRDYLHSRPILAETEAIQRAAILAAEAGARLHIVHISSGRGVATALEARARGVDISIETCPHYLFFTSEDMERIGAVAKCAPPLRDATEREGLWTRLLAGEIDIIASDHSPAPPHMKQDPNFFRVWGGIAGVQSTFGVLFDPQRAVPLQRIASLTAAKPAGRFQIAGKGEIRVGNDADFVLIDLPSTYRLDETHLLYRHRISPYLGHTFRGIVRRTILRGTTIFQDGHITAKSSGRFVAQAPKEPPCNA